MFFAHPFQCTRKHYPARSFPHPVKAPLCCHFNLPLHLSTAKVFIHISFKHLHKHIVNRALQGLWVNACSQHSPCKLQTFRDQRLHHPQTEQVSGRDGQHCPAIRHNSFASHRRGRKAISCAAASETAGRFKWSETARRSKRPLLPSNGADALMRRSNQNREVGIYCVQNFQESRVLPGCIWFLEAVLFDSALFRTPFTSPASHCDHWTTASVGPYFSDHINF